MNTSKQTQQQSSQSAPWSVQQPYLSQAFSEAQNAYNQAKTAQAPTDFTAQFTPEQIGAFTKMLNYGTGNTGIANSSAQAGGTLTGAGSSGVQDAINKLRGYTPQGGIASDIAAGNAYLAGQDIPSQVRAALTGANQEASEQTLPSIARAAAGSGNVNSSRRAIQEGIVQRGLAQKAADIDAELRANAFNTGAQLNESNTQASNQNVLSSILGLLQGGNTAVGTGVGANTGAVGQQGGLFDIASGGVAGQQAGAQANLTNQEQQFEAKSDDPFRALQNFYNIIGANNWGGQSSGTATTTSKPSVFQTIGGLLTAAGGFLHSDRDMKQDIKRVGILDNGLPVYRFRYKSNPTGPFYLGLMAQDVEEVMPEAVKEDGYGFKMVNYKLATE